MDYEMESTENKDLTDRTIDMEWQIDSEWINLSTTPGLSSPNNKKGKHKSEALGSESSMLVSFHFIPTSKGGKYLVIENQPLRLSQKRASGYSYWVCSIPCCSARCVLDPEEKKIVRICKTHNHDADISRQEYKKFINALKIAVKENPHVKPKALYDSEIEKAKEKWRQSKLKSNDNEEEPSLPTFDKVRTAMYNSRNAVLSSVSLKATEEDFAQATPETTPQAGPSRATRSKDGKANPKRKSTPSKTAMRNNLDLEELEEEWSSEPHKDANLSDFEEWLDDDVNFNITSPVVSNRKSTKSVTTVSKKTHSKEAQDSSQEFREGDEDEDETDEDWRTSTQSSSDKAQEEDINFHFMPSSRGCNILIIDGCLLHQNNQHASGKSYWRCQKKGCFFRAVFDPKVNKVTKTTGLHNHPPDSNQMMRRQFINNVKSQIIEHPHVSAKEMYDMEVKKVKQELTELGMSWKIPPFSCVKHHAYRARKSINLNDDVEVEEEEMPEEQPLKRQITETEKKFLEETISSAQDEDISLSMPLLSPGPVPKQSKNFPDCSFYFIPSKKGKRILVVNDYTFRLNSLKSGDRYYWKCTVDPCMFRCVYNENLKDLVKISGKHNHMTNIHKLRTREFCYLIKACMTEDATLTPKKAYDREIAKISALQNGEQLVKFLPAYSSIRTSLYNLKHKRALEEEQGIMSGLPGSNSSGHNNYYHTSSYLKANSESSLESRNNIDSSQEISPKDITHLSLEDNDPMEHDDEDKDIGSASSASNNSMDIAAPSLYDSHDIIDQYCESTLKGKMSVKQEETTTENLVIIMPDPSTYTLSFVPTSRGGRALVVNGCVLRISYTREYVTYWRCLNIDCSFRCSYDSKTKRLLRTSGEHNHPVNKYSAVIRTFVRKLKKRVSQENELSPKIIYEEELVRLKGDEKDVDLFKRLPSFDSLKSSLYKVKSKFMRQSTSLDESLDYITDESDEDRDDVGLQDSSDISSIDDPPDDPVIEECFSTLNANLPLWLEQKDKHIIDGHLLVKKSISDASTGWACSKDGCPFRCVIDKETNTVTRNQWDHTHKSVIKQTIAQAMFNAVKKRAIMDLSILPKTIYEQEKKRLLDKMSRNKTLLKFIPSFSQVYQLVARTRANHASLTLLTTKPTKDSKSKKTCKLSDSNGSGTNSNSNGSHFDSDYLLEQCENEGYKVNSHVGDQQQQDGLLYNQGATNILPSSILESTFSSNDQSSFPPSTSSYTTILSSNTLNPNNYSQLDHSQQHPGQQLFTDLDKTPHYSPDQLYHQQKLQATSAVPKSQHIDLVNILDSSQSVLIPTDQSTSPPPAQCISLSPNNENIFTLHGYPLLPAMTQMGNIYWQCRVPGCQYQCVLNAGTSQVVQISGNHNHEPPGSHSAFCSQVIKMLQRKASENLDEPLNNVYWKYMKDLRNVLDSDEILNGLPRFLDVAAAMQSARSAMGGDEDPCQIRNVVVGNASAPSKVFEYHFDSLKGSLVVHGDPLVLNWRMNEMSYWRCKSLECRFKCMFDEEQECVHLLNPHTAPCLSSPQGDGRNPSVKRKYPDKPSPRRSKFQRINEMKQKSSH